MSKVITVDPCLRFATQIFNFPLPPCPSCPKNEERIRELELMKDTPEAREQGRKDVLDIIEYPPSAALQICMLKALRYELSQKEIIE